MTKTYCDWCKKEMDLTAIYPVEVNIYREEPEIDYHLDLCNVCFEAIADVGVNRGWGYAIGYGNKKSE